MLYFLNSWTNLRIRTFWDIFLKSNFLFSKKIHISFPTYLIMKAYIFFLNKTIITFVWFKKSNLFITIFRFFSFLFFYITIEMKILYHFIPSLSLCHIERKKKKIFHKTSILKIIGRYDNIIEINWFVKIKSAYVD